MSAKTAIGSALGIAAFGGLGFLVLWPCPSSAHDEAAQIGDVAIDQVAAMSARAGETTRVTFSIENSGFERVTITGIRLPTGEPSRVVGFYGTSHSGEIGGLSVAPGETARLDGKNAWIEVGPLKQDLVPDTVVSASLVLGPYEAPLSIHVSSPPEAWPRHHRSPARGSNAVASHGPAWLQGIRC